MDEDKDALTFGISTGVQPVEFEVKQEKRFAAVMYGGVSLAIYMSGVTQELYRLVQSTSKQVKIPEGSATVYRDIAKELNAKFVIDILSGTSAGGINAVFLAKALASGRSLEKLESLWIRTANIDGLINDSRGLGVKKTLRLLREVLSPSSLLNGRKMYDEVKDALEEMEREEGQMLNCPVMDEMDLFVTATDLEGRVVPVEILGEQVNEREHRHVFHLQKTPGGEGLTSVNHFGPEYNDFIAFAARCTSSFPVAFEPVQLSNLAKANERWRCFFEAATVHSAGNSTGDFSSRVFADGGYLDNKPFSHAINAILSRHTDAPVDRKLIYIEPSPEVLFPLDKEDKDPRIEPPDAIENAIKAFTLARYETIRQDLQQLKSRNRLIERTNRILKGTEEDISNLSPINQPPNVFAWREMSLKKMVKRQGFGYGGYFRLRVARLTDELAEIICRKAGIDPDSDGFLAVRDLVRDRRDATYDYYDGESAPTKTSITPQTRYNRFILDYDFGFPYRRLGFVISIIDRLLLAGPEAQYILKSRGFESGPEADSEFHAELKRYRELLTRYRREVLNRQRSLLDSTNGRGSQLSKAVADLLLEPEKLVGLLRTSPSDEGRREKARKFLMEKGRLQAFGNVLKVVKAEVLQVQEVMSKCKTDLGLPEHSTTGKWNPKPPREWKKRARWILQFYFRYFAHYDVVSYPLMQISPLGEEMDEVEIIRISPRDPGQLAGSKYGNFGAFFDETWRNNDILRGRLDGARGIIGALYPDPSDAEKRQQYTDRAEEEIAREWIKRYNEKQEFLAEVMTAPTQAKRKSILTALSRVYWLGSTSAVREEIHSILTGTLGANEFLRRFKAYSVNPSPSPELMVRAITRLVHVFGKMLTGIAHKRGHNRLEKISKYIAQTGAIAISLVEVFLPGSWWELLSRRLLQVLMILGLLMIGGSVWLSASELDTLGAFVFGLAFLLELIRLAIGHFFRTGQITRLLLLLLVVAGLALLVNGIVFAPDAVKEILTWLRGLTL